MVFRLSNDLKTRIKCGPLGALSVDEYHGGPFADWSARLFTADRTPYILLSNTRSLYSTVMYARGVTDQHHFIVRATSSIREFMEDDGLEFIYRAYIEPAMNGVRFCKALNRSVIGSMNELVAVAQAELSAGDCAPHDVGFKLNEILLSALDESSGNYGRPGEAFRRLG